MGWRLFVAAEVPSAVRSAVEEAVAPLHSRAPGLRWVEPARYHLTVVFLGSVDESLVPAVVSALREGCAGVAPFTLSLDGTLGTFGRRVLWAGLEPSPVLSSLASSVAAAVGEVVALRYGDREYHAHLTLARSAREPVRSRLVRGVSVPALSWPVDRVALMRSANGYSVVEAVALDGGDA